MEIIVPAITNPGVSFTSNSYEIMNSINRCFRDFNRSSIPYAQFQEIYQSIDQNGDSKIRMLFPLYRKAGCIFPDDNGSVIFEDGSFLTQLGRVFLMASDLYYNLLGKKSNSFEFIRVMKKARELYFGISKELYKNLSSGEDVYINIVRFVKEYKIVTKKEVLILLYVLEETSPIRENLQNCTYNKGKIDALMTAYKAGNLDIRLERSNNAAQYFLAVLRSLLILDYNNQKFFLSEEAKQM